MRRNVLPAALRNTTGRGASHTTNSTTGYVLTVHKAQGSQWDDVVLFDESSAFQEGRERWLYTGVTRAAKKLTIVV